MTEAPKLIAFLAARLQRGEIAESINVYEYLLTLPTVHARRNPYVFTSDSSPLKIIDLVQSQSRPFVDTLSYISTGTFSRALSDGRESGGVVDSIVLTFSCLVCPT